MRVLAQFSSLLSTALQELTRCWLGRIEPQHLGKMLPSLSEPALLGQGNAQIVVSAHIAGPEPQCLGIMLNGLVEAALVGQGNSQVMMGLGKIGLETECFRILLNRFQRFVLSKQGIPP